MKNRKPNNNITDDDMRVALEQGTRSMVTSAPAVWGKIAANRGKSKRLRWAWPMAATATLAMAAVAFVVFIVPAWFTPPDVVKPLASATQTAKPVVITLTTDIEKYSPLMSSAFGIHIFAKDGSGSPVKGKWTTSWGGFVVSAQQLGELQAEVEAASDTYWCFSPGKNNDFTDPVPEIITVNFMSDSGEKQTLRLLKDPEMDLLVTVDKGQAIPTARPSTIMLSINSSRYSPMVNSRYGILIVATDTSGNPVKGDWTTTWGYFRGEVYYPGEVIQEIKGASEATWSFYTQDNDTIPNNIQVDFIAANGEKLTLHLKKDPKNALWVYVPDGEAAFIKVTPKETKPVD